MCLGHLHACDAVVANTFFDKPPTQLITFRETSNPSSGPPYIRGKFEVLDYVLVPHRWRNSIRNVRSDMKANIPSDHYPLISTLRIRLKTLRKPDAPDRKYKKDDRRDDDGNDDIDDKPFKAEPLPDQSRGVKRRSSFV